MQLFSKFSICEPFEVIVYWKNQQQSVDWEQERGHILCHCFKLHSATNVYDKHDDGGEDENCPIYDGVVDQCGLSAYRNFVADQCVDCVNQEDDR